MIEHESTITELQSSNLRANNNHLQIWLSIIYILALAIVIVGGVTRLTDSGLSITEWQPIRGTIPPLNQAEWMEEFEKYQQIPQYQILNKGMTLNEFKNIYWWEWGHRFLGRIIGLAFIIPFAYFLLKRKINKRWIPHLIALFALGSIQGFFGWWMVKSGLADRTDVSQYRLALHLTVAGIILSYIIFLLHRISSIYRYQTGQLSLRVLSILIALLLTFQIIFGALTAGLNAGMTFNTWPLMDGKWVPDGLFLLDPIWNNFFENILTVQFQHRIMAYILVLLTIWQYLLSLKTSERRLIKFAVTMLGLTLLQTTFGIITLVLVVPFSMALIHQFFAIILLSVSIWHLSNFPVNERRLLRASNV